MYQTIKKLFELLTPRERRRGVLLLCMIVVMALLDMIGIASIVPFMSVLADPQIVSTSHYLATLYANLPFTSPQSFLTFLGFAVFALFLLSTVFKALTTYALLRFSLMREYSIGARLVAGYLRQPYDWYLNRHSADLGKTVLSEVSQVIGGSLVPMMQVVAQTMVAVAIIGLLLIVNPRITLFLVVGVGTIYIVIYLFFRRYLQKVGQGRVDANRLRYQVVQEAFGGIKDVKVGGLESLALEQFSQPALRYARYQTNSQLVSQLPRYALEALAVTSMLVLALYMSQEDGGLAQALPLIALYGLAALRLLPALQQIYSYLATIRFSDPVLARAHAEFVALNTLPESVQTVAMHRLPLKASLILDGVTYRYPNSAKPAANVLNMEISAHHTVGLVGTTGSGKTTAVDIMLGLLTPQAGAILVDGRPLKGGEVRRWQRSVGYVPQQVYLVDDTVAGNIAFGIPADQIDHAAVQRAAQIANIHDFVVNQLPDAYQTYIGERGVRLSGGQRQRIGIARALYHDPDILFLDEATSALDNLTEQAVMEAVHNLNRKKTIILIAHRLTTVKACDTIFILEQGRVVDQGSYHELLQKNQKFQIMAGEQR